MTRSGEKGPGAGEKISRFGRNFNLAVGIFALAGAAIVPVGGAALKAYAAFNGLQAGGFEVARRHFKKKRTKKSKGKK